jgi:preprotein translocase subunit SecA
MMEWLKVPDDEPIEAPMVSKAVQNAQSRVEGHNFDQRKNLLEYDDVMNMQRRESHQSYQDELVVQIALLSGLLATVLGFITALSV